MCRRAFLAHKQGLHFQGHMNRQRSHQSARKMKRRIQTLPPYAKGAAGSAREKKVQPNAPPNWGQVGRLDNISGAHGAH